MNHIHRAAAALLTTALATPAFAAGTTDLDEIVVTAELIRRPLRVTGTSVEILDADTLARRPGLATVRDVLDTIPNLSMVTGTGKAPTVRGIDGTGPAENANAFFAGSRARLSWRIDGRPASYNEVVFGDIGIWDVDRIEILRGAQSSLVGRNAIAGTIVVETRDPSFDTEGAAQVAAGNRHQRRASAMLNLPIAADSVALRLSADWSRRDSATHYTSYAGVADPARGEGLVLRGKLLLAAPSDPDLRLVLTAAHTEYRGPNGEIVVRPFKDRVSNFPRQPVHKPRTDSLGAELGAPLGQGLAFEGFVSATDFHFARKAVPGSTNATVDTTEYVVEPRLRYAGDNGLSGVAGIYSFRARQKEFIEFLGGQNFRDRSDTVALYGEGVVPLSPAFDLSLGARYEREKRRRNGGDATGTLVRIAADETYHAFLPKAGLTWKPDARSAYGLQLSRGYNSGGGGVAFVFPIVNYEYKAEYVWTAEIFGRQSWAGGRVRTTQNLFVSRYRDMQLPFDLTPNDSRDEAFVVRNADRVRTWGAELGASADLAKGLGARLSVGLLGTDVARYPGSGIEGNDLLTAPSVTAGGGLDWTSGPFSASTSLRYSGGYFTDVNNRPRGRTDPYLVADLQLAWQLGGFRLFGSVRNLFDSEKPVARYPGIAPTGSTQPDSAFDSAVLLQPRTLTVGLQAKF